MVGAYPRCCNKVLVWFEWGSERGGHYHFLHRPHSRWEEVCCGRRVAWNPGQET